MNDKTEPSETIMLCYADNGQVIAYFWEEGFKREGIGDTASEAIGELVRLYPEKFNIAHIRW